ncbi:uncharacterized protein CCOS01_06976, partial [Colletotrichum costaricense]
SLLSLLLLLLLLFLLPLLSLCISRTLCISLCRLSFQMVRGAAVKQRSLLREYDVGRVFPKG